MLHMQTICMRKQQHVRACVCVCTHRRYTCCVRKHVVSAITYAYACMLHIKTCVCVRIKTCMDYMFIYQNMYLYIHAHARSLVIQQIMNINRCWVKMKQYETAYSLTHSVDNNMHTADHILYIHSCHLIKQFQLQITVDRRGNL